MSRNQRGGARNRVPIPGDELTNIQTLDDFKKKMNIYLVHGHGIISSRNDEKGTVFIVPPKTYVLFNMRAGIPGEKIKTGAMKEETEKFLYRTLIKNEKNNNKERIETSDEWSQRIYDSMKNGTFFQKILYEKDKAFLETKGVSVYEPGDLIQNLAIEFHNPTFPYMMLGIWKLPVPPDVKNYLNDINNSTLGDFNNYIKDDLILMEAEANKLTDITDKDYILNTIIPFIKKLTRTTLDEESSVVDNPKYLTILLKYPAIRSINDNIYKKYRSIASLGDKESYFINHYDNLAKNFPSIKNTRNTTLYNILYESSSGAVSTSSLPVLPTKDTEGKDVYRLIIIDACRSLAQDQPFELTLRRSLSGYSRPEICLSSLLRFTKSAFEALPGYKQLKETSVIKKLVRGEEVKTSDFEEELAPIEYKNENKSTKREPYTLPQLLEYHKFNQGDQAIYYSPYDPISRMLGFGSATGTIQGVNVGKNGSIQYMFKVRGRKDPILVPALDLWPSEEVYVASQAKSEAQHKQLSKLIKEQEEQKKLMEEAEKKAEEEAEEKQKKEKEEYARINAERKAQETLKELMEAQTFKDLKHLIDTLPADKKALVKHQRRVLIQLNPVPQKTSPVYGYHGIEAVVQRVIEKTNKDGTKYVGIVVDPVLTEGKRSNLKNEGITIPVQREFRAEFLFSVPPKKGGKSTRKNKKKHRKTRKH